MGEYGPELAGCVSRSKCAHDLPSNSPLSAKWGFSSDYVQEDANTLNSSMWHRSRLLVANSCNAEWVSNQKGIGLAEMVEETMSLQLCCCIEGSAWGIIHRLEHDGKEFNYAHYLSGSSMISRLGLSL